MHSRRSAHVSMALSLALAATACRDIAAPADTDIAFFAVEAIRVGSEFSTSPVGIFIRSGPVQIPSSIVSAERCSAEPFPDDGSLVATFLDAGPNVAASVSGNGATMFRTTSGAQRSYELSQDESIPFEPGDSIAFTFTLPGAASGATPYTVKGRTAEALTPESITLADDQEPVTIDWDDAQIISGSAILYSFRYALPPSTTLNRQISCVFFDDGSATASGTLLSDFRAATVREVEATRFRVRTETVENLLVIISSTLSELVAVNTP